MLRTRRPLWMAPGERIKRHACTDGWQAVRPKRNAAQRTGSNAIRSKQASEDMRKPRWRQRLESFASSSAKRAFKASFSSRAF